jgi:drug/metabolite transporter (DMT)-like permease
MLEAALAPLLAFVFFNEVPAMRSIIGGVIIFFSILYFITSVSRNTSKEKNV